MLIETTFKEVTETKNAQNIYYSDLDIHKIQLEIIKICQEILNNYAYDIKVKYNAVYSVIYNYMPNRDIVSLNTYEKTLAIIALKDFNAIDILRDLKKLNAKRDLNI